MIVTFTFEGVVWQVKRSARDPARIIYRDVAHLGGPWSDALGTIDEKRIKPGFRKLLRQAVDQITNSKE